MTKKDIQMLLWTHGQDFKFDNKEYKVYPKHIIEAMVKDKSV